MHSCLASAPHRLGSTGGFHCRRLADSRLVGFPAWCRASCDRDRLPAGLELHVSLLISRRQRHLKWVLGFTTKPPVEIAEAFQPLGEEPPCWPFEIVSAVGGYISGDVRLDSANHPAAGHFVLNRIAPSSKIFCVMSYTTFAAGILSGTDLRSVCRALLFFHPAAWYAVRKMQFDRELACDLAVVSRLSRKKSNVCGVSGSFRAVEFITRPEGLGYRFRGVVGTFEGSCSLDLGWIRESLLVG